jgi:MFS family permease
MQTSSITASDDLTTAPQANSATGLLPIMAVVALAFLIIGFVLPVLPLHVHLGLGLGAFIVGLVTGSQFLASVLTRVWAGRFADQRGPKRAVMTGLLGALASGGLYLLSLLFLAKPWVSVGVLLAGRATLGAAESFIITGAAAWGLAIAGPQQAGRVIAWVGMAMFASMALGAPLGMALYGAGGFVAVAVGTIIIPLLTLLLVLPLRPTAVSTSAPSGLLRVAKAVWLPGIGSALSSLGYGAVLAFGALLANERGWNPVWLNFTAFACALVAARLFFGHVPDRLGGAKVALGSVIIEGIGLALLWHAPGPLVAAIGAALTGFGYALVYPGLGVEAVRRAPPESRGLAMGAYTVFLDVALGFGGPALGLVAAAKGLSAAFLVAAILVLSAAGIAAKLLASLLPEKDLP